ncbi:MAG: HD domain-containing phosphohydrolase [Pseudomonadota bacterium]
MRTWTGLAWLCLALLVLPLRGVADTLPDTVREVRIGVLALRGPQRVMTMWAPTAHYLQGRLPDLRFRVVPLDFDEIHLAVRQKSVDFVLANPAFYVELESLYGVSPVVTMRNRHDGGPGFSQFGGVIFTRADHNDIRTLSDLKGRSFLAVDRNSYGGWHVAWREMLRQGVDPEKDFKSLEFAGTHDAVVKAILVGKADAGTVRTETLERMVAEGSLRMGDLYVLNEQQHEDFPLALSTPLYPEWPLAKVKGVPDSLAVRVAVTLMQLPAEDPAARAGQIVGWTLPLNYQPIHEVLRTLRIGPYTHLRELKFADILDQYGKWLAVGLAFLFFALAVAAHVGRMNHRLRAQKRELNQLNSDLEDRVRERTERVESLLDRERYLRVIVAMVADINEILITTGSQEEMLKACCDRLVAHPDYRFAWVSLLLEGELAVVSKSYGAANLSRKLRHCLDAGPAVRAVEENQTILVMGDEMEKDLRDLGIVAVSSIPLRPDAYSEPIGALCVLTVRVDGFDHEEVAMLEQLAGDMGFAIQAYRQRGRAEDLQQERIANYEETIISLVDMIEKRDTYTAGHTRRVALYCEKVARHLGVADADIERLKGAATLHDIGKIVIPDAVLLKPGSLTPLEYDLIKQHAEVGYETLSGIKMYRDLAEIMRYHHERHDGSGYPQGLKGEAIPLLSRIMAVADAFDAMTTNRIYKPRRSVGQALEELVRLAGSEFDPEVVEAARVALADAAPPSLADQLPKTLLERQRFAYFFNDHLTGLHNAEYLRFMTRNGLDVAYGHGWLILLRHFSAYNAQAGWAAGNRLLAEFANLLVARYPQALLCRVMGDDFVLLAGQPLELDAESLNRLEVLAGTPVRAEVRSLALGGERSDLLGLL